MRRAAGGPSQPLLASASKLALADDADAAPLPAPNENRTDTNFDRKHHPQQVPMAQEDAAEGSGGGVPFAVAADVALKVRA